ncbi:helix-turn-helix domain-containing protein [Desulfovibrio intestinalis]|uniref:DNA-binding XRE family transcriptional regulator n=1 Tax=Desulfovibrio intestinalis TaxID=58621 RepID=A0A7W8C3W6_9BACT|nr:helix-turn-helix transcriptional regulator [Desulfovibrio intestinalis]MBB5144328.1 DNA-binding XRE family transcriptional regulator [Desulfovibrio intestinalis]
MRLPYHIRNLQRIEGGIRQPGVMLALRMVVGVRAVPGDFFQRLLEADITRSLCLAEQQYEPVPVMYHHPEVEEDIKCLFGPLLAQARVAGGVSQTAMAKTAKYNLRNVNAVEKGRQEPGVMSALALVAATGVGIRDFFNSLSEFSGLHFEE